MNEFGGPGAFAIPWIMLGVSSQTYKDRPAKSSGKKEDFEFDTKDTFADSKSKNAWEF
jgi:hypothetical protein